MSPIAASMMDSKQQVAGTVTAVALTTFALIKVYKAKQRKKQLKFPYPPGPPPTSWLLGNALELPDMRTGKHLDVKLLEWAHTYGTVFSLKLPFMPNGAPMIVIANPALAKQVLVTKNYPKSPTYRNHQALFGERSLVVLPNKEWAQKRRAFNPGFAPSFLKSVVPLLATKLTRLLQAINQDIDAEQQQQPTNMILRSQVFTTDVIVQVAFGEDWGVDKSLHFRQVFTELQEAVGMRATNVVAKVFGYRLRWRIRQLTKQLDNEMRAVLERHLAAREQQKTAADNSDDNNITDDEKIKKKSTDIISLAVDQIIMASNNNENGKDGSATTTAYKLTEDDKLSITHQLKTIYFAGNETSATAMSWCIWLLSQHPRVLQKLRHELEQHGVWAQEANNKKKKNNNVDDDDDNKTVPTYDQLQQCEYLDAVIKETLRLYPPAGGARLTTDLSETWTPPNATDNDPSEETYSIGGCVLYVTHYVMHRHPDLWKRPNDFIPERFLDGSEENIQDKFVVFSRGPRDCIGKYFAMLEIKVAVSRLCLDYDFDVVDKNEEYIYKVTSVPRNGAQVVFRHRPSKSSAST